MNGTLTLARMQVRDLGRRRIAVGMLVALPLLVYLSVPADQTWALGPGAVGLGWSVGGAAMFAALGWRRVDPRLSLAGFRPAVQVAGRALPIGALGLVLGGAILPLLLARSSPPDGGALVLAVVLTVVVGVPLGLAIGAVLPREMEAMLALIMVGGVAMSMPPDAPGAQVLPLWGPVRLVTTAIDAHGAGLAGPVAHATASVVLLGVVAWVAWRRRVRVRTTGASVEAVSPASIAGAPLDTTSEGV